MNENASKFLWTRFLLILAALVVIVAGMRAAAPIIVPFLLAVFIAVIFSPPLFWMHRKGVPIWLATIIVVAGIVVIGLVLTAFVSTSLDDFSRNLPVYQGRLKEATVGVLSWLRARGVDVPGVEVPDQLFLQYFDPGAAMQIIAGLLAGLSGALANAFLILLTVVFILLEASSLPAKLRCILNQPDESLARLSKVTEGVNRYLAIKTLVSLLTGILIMIWLAIFGVDYPVLWGLVAFMLNYVPNIGSIIAAIPGVLMALVQYGPGRAMGVALGYVLVNVVVGNLIEPRFMGRVLGLSTLVVFLSLVFWGWVLGPVGMLLSVPLTMILKIALDYNEDTKWIAILLGSETPAAAVSAGPDGVPSEEPAGSEPPESLAPAASKDEKAIEI